MLKKVVLVEFFFKRWRVLTVGEVALLTTGLL